MPDPTAVATTTSNGAAFDGVTALASALDLANGLPEDKSVLTAVFAAELAAEIGAAPDQQSDAFMAGLLRHLGCTAYASRESDFAQDDIALRRALLLAGGDGGAQVLSALLQANRRWPALAAAVLTLLRRRSGLRSDWTLQACEAARLLAVDLGCSPAVVLALDEVFENWDGSGAPSSKARERISPVSRIAQAANAAVLVWLSVGAADSSARLRSRSAGAVEDRLVQVAAGLLPRLDAPDFLPAGLQRARATVAAPRSCDAVASAFGDFADLQSPHTPGHSRAVRALARAIALQCAMPADELADLELAASLHDLGQVALPTSLWLAPRAWRPAERALAASHSFHGERLLAGAAPLARSARIVGGHHPASIRGTVTGGWPQGRLSEATAILAAAEIACGMRERRPQREALRLDAVVAQLRSPQLAPAIGPRVVDACVACLGMPGDRTPDRRSDLTEREREILRHIAHGATNKQTAKLLGISDRTVQTHTLRIYQKLGVATRAGATLVAARQGLTDD